MRFSQSGTDDEDYADGVDDGDGDGVYGADADGEDDADAKTGDGAAELMIPIISCVFTQ